MRAIGQKMGDIQNAWFMKFTIGEKDPETDWEEFVKEYNAVGAKAYLEEFQINVEKAENEYKKVAK